MDLGQLQRLNRGWRWWLLVVMTAAAILGFAACRPNPPAPLGKLQISVSIAPQRYFVERVGGEFVTVNVMVPPGAEPHTFEPKPQQLQALSQADAYLKIGTEFEAAWLGRIQALHPTMVMVDTTQGIERQPLPGGSAGAAPDPHIWLSPALVKLQTQTIYQALAALDPPHQPQYQANLRAFLADIDRLDGEIRQALQGVKNRRFLVFHPSWGYFARDYDLEMITIQVGGQEPSAAELVDLIRRAQQAHLRVVFAQPQFSQQAARTLA
ncbi:MAG: zinc ABC transporter substrate-binding protein, partial [Cyanobacteriota bacterium]|nr:zinc ABC transporter substrate-binding protein [Cyanobacteriota bacterium]